MTNLTCEIDGGGIRIFEGYYDYYEWKNQQETQSNSSTPKVKNESRKKSDYKKRKKIRNRLTWIDKRFKTIENLIEKERALTNNPSHSDDYEKLQSALNNMNTLEKEYLELIDERERLLN